MNALNRAVTAFFDVVLTPLEAVSDEFALLVVSGVFGVLALWIFKHISWQKGIKATKNKIKGHLIEIRLYQDDLWLVTKAIGKVLLRNFQYLFLNFGPFVPLAIPFALVAAQMVVRYGFEPAPVQHAEEHQLAGGGMTLTVEGESSAIENLEFVLPDGLTALQEMHSPRQGVADLEFLPERPGTYDIVVRTSDQEVTKRFVAGEEAPVRMLQGRRVRSLFEALLWPAEDTLAGTGLESVRFTASGKPEGYPESDLGWLPFSGPIGVLLVFVLASMVMGFAALKP
ncbi:MAG: hypothetical protein AAGA20_03995, partial [Planctomycetota bacterium]